MRALILIPFALVFAFNAAAEEFKPTSLPGKQVSLSELGITFTLPKGWKGSWQQTAQGKGYVLQAPGVSPNEATLTLAAVALGGAEKGKSAASLLDEAVAQSLGQLQQMFAQAGGSLQVAPGAKTKSLEVSGRQAARRLERAEMTVPGQGGAQVVLYFAGLKGESWGYVLSGNWSAKHSKKMEGGADSILASMRVKAPAQNEGLAAKLTGCWHYQRGTTDPGSYDRSSRTMRLFKDGRYAFESRNVVSVSGAGTATSGDKEAGTWKVVGDSLFLQPQNGAAYQVPVSLKDGMVTAGGKRYLPCR